MAVSLSSVRLYAVLIISLLLYCAGLLQNDYFDLEEDRHIRPSRPIPSGRVSALAVIFVASLLAAVGVATAFLVSIGSGVIASILVLIMTAYNHSAKGISVVGPILMGLCRGLSFSLGASVLGWDAIFTPAMVLGFIFLSVFIATVTHIAASETDCYKSGAMRWGPGVTLVAWFGGLFLLINPRALNGLVISIVLVSLAAFWELYCGSLLVPNAPSAVVQQTIGHFLRGLLLIQAAMIALAGYPSFIVIVALLVAWPVSQKLARYFYAS